MRALCVASGLAAVVWAAFAFRSIPDFGPVQAIGDRIARGDSYSPAVTLSLADKAEADVARTCDANFLVQALFIQARAVEVDIETADLIDLERRFDETEGTAVHLIECAPTESFAWLTLFWTRSMRSGYSASLIPLLEESYRTGPSETWVQLHRSRIAMPLCPQLSQELRGRVLNEYMGLIQLYRLEIVIDVFLKLDNETRAIVVSRLPEIPRRPRTFFVQRLARAGIELNLPELLDRPGRPWLYR